MGNRANIIVVDQGRRVVLLALGGQHAARRPCLGPEHGLRFARSQAALDASDPDAWLDTTWCEGVALIDVKRRVLAVGDAECGLDRGYLHLLYQQTWPGWDVVWAPDGLCSVFDYLGINRRRAYSWEESGVSASGRDVYAGRRRSARHWSEDEGTACSVVLSTSGVGAQHVWTTDFSVGEHFLVGPEPFESHRPGPVEPVVSEDPVGGIHVDFDRRTVSVWNASTSHKDLEYFTKRFWSEFTLERWYDRFDEQNAALGASIIVPKFDRPGIRSTFEHIATLGLPANWTNPADRIAALLARDGTSISLSSAMSAHQPVAPEGDNDAALAALVDMFGDVLDGSAEGPPPSRVILRDGSLSSAR